WLLVKALMTKAGADYSKVKTVVADPSVLISGLLSGQWDSYCGAADADFLVLQKQAAQKGVAVNETLLADWGLQAIGYVIVASSNLMQSNPNLLKAFVRATIKSVQYTMNNPG